MNKNLNLALITIGNGDWKSIMKNIWDSLDICEEGFKLDRCYEEYFYKLEMDDTELPSELTNNPMKIADDYILRLVISMPVESKHKDNYKMVLSPWHEEEVFYYVGSKVRSEKIARSEYCDNVIILCGDNLEGEEREYRHEIAQLCVDNNKTFWEIGNDSKININGIIKWIESGENYCSYYPDNVKRYARVGN